MDESFPVKRFKSNKMINRATSGSDATLHINKSTVDHLFHGFTDTTCQCNRFGFGSLPGFGVGMIIAFLQSEGKSPDIQMLLNIFKSKKKKRISVNILEVDNVFHLVLMKYHGLYAEYPATPCCIRHHFQMKG